MTLRKSMHWGLVGAGIALVVCWCLMFTVKSAQPVLTLPLDRFMGWLDSRFGVRLVPHEDIGAAFLWLSVYFLILGFIPASVAALLVRRHRQTGA
jgi:hypothetical protein